MNFVLNCWLACWIISCCSRILTSLLSNFSLCGCSFRSSILQCIHYHYYKLLLITSTCEVLNRGKLRVCCHILTQLNHPSIKGFSFGKKIINLFQTFIFLCHGLNIFRVNHSHKLHELRNMVIRIPRLTHCIFIVNPQLFPKVSY